jgi:hypothetical protein
LFFFSFSFLTLHPKGWLRHFFANYKFLKTVQLNLHNHCETDDTISNQNDDSSFFYNFFIKYVAIKSEGDRVPCCYYTKGVSNGGRLLGFGDFLIYNVLLLLILSLFPSTEVKEWVAFGFIVSIIIGQLGTYYLEQVWKAKAMPGLPLPVISFSAYVLFLDTIMTASEECVYL